MAEHAINTQIIDAVGETGLDVAGHAPQLSHAYLDTLMAETTGLMMNQAVMSQQSAQTAGNASLTAACAKILRVPLGKPVSQSTVIPAAVGSPLDHRGLSSAGIQGHYSKARSAINTLKHDLRKAKIHRENASDFLDSLADLAKPANAENGSTH